MKKVLYIGTTNIYGGVGHIMFELCKNINRENIQFDFLYYEKPTEEEKIIIKNLGASFYYVPRYSKNPVGFWKSISKFYEIHHYDIIHVHASSAMLIMYTMPIWKNKKVKIVYQSHIDLIKGVYNQILHALFKPVVNKYTDCRLAVSEKAAEFMYGEKYVKDTVILKNGVEIKKFLFEESIRKKVRKELRIDSKYVIGHVGRFSAQKNHPFIIDLFANIHKKCPDSVLLLVGNGEDEATVHKQVKEYKLIDSVIFYGTSSSVNELLCAMDCFLFPSLWEGLGIVAIEAQASGLPVVASDKVPLEANITDLFYYKKLNDSIEEWSNCVMQFQNLMIDRKKYIDIVMKSGYDIQEVGKQLEKIYIDS